MNSIKILVFDEEEITQTIIENYLKDFVFPFSFEKYSEFDEGIVQASSDNKIIIVNINKLNDELLSQITELSKKQVNNFLIISYDDSTDLRVKALRTGAKDFLLKPLIKTDFLYSLQHIYKNFIIGKDKKTSEISVFYSSQSSEENIVFIYNLAEEINSLSGEKVLIVDFPSSDINFFGFFNFKEKLQELNNINISEFQKVTGKQIYLLALSQASCENFEAEITKLTESFNYILININENTNNEIKERVLECLENIFYVISCNNSHFYKIKSDLKILSKKHFYIIADMYDKRDDIKLEQIQSFAGIEVSLKLHKNINDFNRSYNLRKTYREINPNNEISEEYTKIARKIMNRT